MGEINSGNSETGWKTERQRDVGKKKGKVHVLMRIDSIRRGPCLKN